ncbi:hypothetical protein ACWF9G_15045 [Nocardia sp. NPDC055029]
MMFEPLPPDDARRIGRYRLLATLHPTAVFRTYLGAGADDQLYLVQQPAAAQPVDRQFRIRLRHSAVAASRTVHPAADIFALGSILAFAASGKTPFAAPSVAYTLFNIAQRDPALDAVPTELRELIWGCLRKEPADRPTPGQILRYLGPGSAPAWPAPVAADIDGVRQRCAALVATAPADEPVPRGLSFARVAGAVRSGWTESRRRWAGASRRQRAAVAVGTAACLVVAGGTAVVAATVADDQPLAALTGLSLAELRTIDGCAWLDRAIDGPVGVAPTPIPEADWKLQPTSGWGCSASYRAQTIYLDLGAQYREPGRETVLADGEIDGVPIRHVSPTSCGRVIASPGAESQAGISVWISSSAKECGTATDELIAGLARTLDSAPRRSGDQPNSLATVAPCDLLDKAVIDQAVGPLPAAPTVADAHTCTWDGQVAVSIELQRDVKLKDPETTTVDGVDLVLVRGGGSSCARGYRNPGADLEFVEVSVRGGDGRSEAYCRLATTVLRAAVDRLPVR